VLQAADVRRLLDHVRHHRNASRNRVMVLLSFKAGLRACEIARLDWHMVVRASGGIGDVLYVGANIAKMGSARSIPLANELRAALRSLHVEQGQSNDGPVCRSERGSHLTAGSVVNWFAATYAELGLSGCSSHSGRRTFITRSARLLTKSGGSLRDIQELAGHRALTTTERYIEGDRDAQRRLIRLI
jgi:integrase/recombinase XerD